METVSRDSSGGAPNKSSKLKLSLPLDEPINGPEKKPVISLTAIRVTRDCDMVIGRRKQGSRRKVGRKMSVCPQRTFLEDIKD
jgi:hypothetical protein